MQRLSPTISPEQFIGHYGPDYKPGVLIDHVEIFIAAGGTVRDAASGSGVAWAMAGGKFAAVPVVCGHLIPLRTEDGLIDGRCGQPVVRRGACRGHAVEMDDWDAMTEAEKAHWERDHEGAF